MRYKKHWGKVGYLSWGNLPEWKGERSQYKMFAYDPRNLPVVWKGEDNGNRNDAISFAVFVSHSVARNGG